MVCKVHCCVGLILSLNPAGLLRTVEIAYLLVCWLCTDFYHLSSGFSRCQMMMFSTVRPPVIWSEGESASLVIDVGVRVCVKGAGCPSQWCHVVGGVSRLSSTQCTHRHHYCFISLSPPPGFTGRPTPFQLFTDFHAFIECRIPYCCCLANLILETAR